MGKAVLKSRALQTLARNSVAHGSREESGVRASSAPLLLLQELCLLEAIGEIVTLQP
jgi:hypothetical protein